MNPVQIDFTLNVGATFNEYVQYLDADKQPIDLTGFTAIMQIRENIDDAVVVLELNTADSTIVLNDQGIVQFNVPHTVTALLTITRGVYDLFLSAPGGEPTDKFLTGAINVRPAVTR